MRFFGEKPDASESAEYVYRAEGSYRAIGGPSQANELRLLKSIADEIERRLPADLPEDERIRRGIQIAAADPKLSSMVAELEELAELRDGPAFWQQPDSG